MTAPDTQTKDDTRLARYEALVRELGPEGFIRYIQQVSPGKGDFTVERRKLLEGTSVTDLEEWWTRRRAANGDDPAR